MKIKGLTPKLAVWRTLTETLPKLYIISHTIHLSISPKTAEIHTLTPKGKPSITIYPIQDFTHLKINHKGNIKTQKKKRFRRNLERIGIFVSEVWVGIN